jgi:hypothetical protein
MGLLYLLPIEDVLNFVSSYEVTLRVSDAE